MTKSIEYKFNSICSKYNKFLGKDILTSISKNKINLYLDTFIENNKSIELINNKLKHRQIKNPILSKEISENIVILILSKLNKKKIIWDNSQKNIEIDDNKIKIKTFTNNSYTTFSIKDNWDKIYFLDITRLSDRIFTLWEIPMSNNSLPWESLRVTKKMTFKDKILSKQRPRIQFNSIRQIKELNLKIIFSGKL